VDLTAQGTADWTHWGLTAVSLLDRKANVVQQIGDFTKIGANAVQRYADNYTGYSWIDGTPTASTNDTTTGVFTTGVTNGFELTVPADTTLRTLKVYAGLYRAQGNFQAWLSDFSAASYAAATLSNAVGNAYAVYTLTYAAASSGQTLTIRYRSKNVFDRDFGNVTLQAATLSVNSDGNIVPYVAITNPANGMALTAPASFTVSASAWDSDGSVSQVEFFEGNTPIGTDSTSPYSATMNDLAAGTYVLSAVATDNLGAKATTSISLVVTNGAPAPVILQHPTWSGNDFGFSFLSQSGRVYYVEYTDALGSGPWQALIAFAGDGSAFLVTNKNVTATQRFYRVESR